MNEWLEKFLSLFKEEHNKPIYGICICEQAIPGENEGAFLFATCATNRVRIWFE